MKSSPVFATSVVAVLLLTAAGPSLAQERPPRTVTVKLAVDRAIPDLVNWRCRANAFLRGPLRVLKSRFGLRLIIGDPVRWHPDNGRRSLSEAMGELRTKVRPEGSDMVVGIISRERISTPSLGIASYPHGYVLLTDRSSPQAMEYAFLHEVCHIFGAIDLKDQGAVMSVTDPGLAIDGFTARAVLLHRDRSFDRGSCPLAKAAIDGAIALYRERVDRGPGEPEAMLFLTLLYLEKDDVESASRACEEAADADPGLNGLHVLLGNIRLRREETDLAIQEYMEALKTQPAEPGVHFDLGLAYNQAHRYSKAIEECRTALRLNEEYLEARLLLARLLLAVGDAGAAAVEGRAALKSDPRSAEALCVLGTALVAVSRPVSTVPGQQTGTPRDARAALAPDSPPAGEAIREAIPLLQRSIALDPNDPEARVSLGSAYAAGRQYPQAEEEFLAALKIRPDDLEAHFALGSLYFETGDLAKAAFYLERIIKIDPASDLGSRIIARTDYLPRSYVILARNPIR